MADVRPAFTNPDRFRVAAEQMGMSDPEHLAVRALVLSERPEERARAHEAALMWAGLLATVLEHRERNVDEALRLRLLTPAEALEECLAWVRSDGHRPAWSDVVEAHRSKLATGGYA